MAKYLLAHDLGTSGNKATLFTTEGALVKSVLRTYSVNFFNSNWAEQNPEEWWQAVCDSTRELVSGIDINDVVGISYSGQMQGCVCVDKDGNSLRPAIIWADMRAREEAELLKEKIGEREFYHITGHKPSSSYGLEKLMWVKNNEPDIYKKTYKVMNAKDYMVLKMTGNYYTEFSDASSTNAFDLNTFTWSEGIVDASGVDCEMFPEAVQSTYVAGELHSKAARECGLKSGIPVVMGGGDGMCASVGAGSVAPGHVYNCLGSSSWVSMTTEKPVYDDQMRTFNFAHIVPGMIGPCGTMQTAGAAFSWLKNTVCTSEGMMQDMGKGDAYELINSQIASSPAGANGVMFLPYLIGERSPWWNPEAKGAFLGLKMENTRADILRSVVEGIGMNLNIILDIICGNEKPKSITVFGGMAKGHIQRQILADIYGIDVLPVVALDEATSMGAAVTAGVGVGALKDFSEVDKFIAYREPSKPIPQNAEKYKHLQAIFEKAYHALNEINSML